MEKETYLLELERIQKEYTQKENELRRSYALANNPYKIGDIFKDYIGSILVERIKVISGYGGSLPSCSYMGLELNKDLTPNKRGKKREAWQVNEKL